MDDPAGTDGTASESALSGLVLTRLFDAPRHLVFQAWTKEEHLEHWQGVPKGFTVTTHKADLRPGGAFQLCMRSPQGPLL